MLPSIQNGGFSRRESAWSSGLCGTISGAKTAVSTIRSRIALAIGPEPEAL